MYGADSVTKSQLIIGIGCKLNVPISTQIQNVKQKTQLNGLPNLSK